MSRALGNSTQVGIMIRRLCAIGLGFALMIGGAPNALAQHLSLAPTIGVYVPGADLAKTSSTTDSYKQEIALNVGARLGIALGSRLGLEATGTYAPSSLRFTTNGTQSTTDAKVITGSGRLFLFALPRASMVSLLLSGGVGLVNRSGKAFQNRSGTTDVGGVVGASLRVRLGGLSLQLNADDYLYKASYQGSVQTSSQTQNDIHLGVGLGSGF